MKKKLFSGFLAFVMVLSMLPAQALAASAAQFTDVPSRSWFHDDVDFVTRNGYYKGVANNVFDPDGAMSRAMLATVLARYAKAAVDDSTSAFADVPADTWYTGSVTWAQQNGIVEGSGGGIFQPEAPVTRQEMAAIFARFVTYYEKANNVKHRAEGTATQFIDEADIAAWALPAVRQCQVYGLLKGTDKGMYLPGSSTTRAQAAAVLHRLSWTSASPVDPPPQTPDVGPEPVKEWTVTMHNGESVTEAQVKDGESYELPTLQAEHKAFKGWAASAGSSEIAYAPGASIPAVTGDMEVWAVWAYTVTLHNEGEADKVVEVTGDTFTAPAMPADAKSNRVFMGWEPEEHGGILYLPDVIINPIPTDLYAVWGWNVTLYNGEKIYNSEGKAEVVRDGGEYTMPAPPTPAPRQVFKGWSTDKDGPVNTSYQQGDKLKVDNHITLYAIFGDTFTVTVKNGDVTIDQAEIERDGQYTVPADPAEGGAHTGCHFMGWTDEENGDVNAAYKAGEAISITQDLTLYAVWGHWVSVYSHNGTEDPVKTERKDGAAYHAPAAPVPAPGDTEFAGWSAGTAGAGQETLYQPGDVVTDSIGSDIELHAVWTDLFTVTYVDGERTVHTDSGIRRGTTYPVKFTLAELDPDGRILMGWATDEALTEIVYTADGANTIEMTGSVTLYAVWGYTVKVFSHTTEQEEPDSETTVQAGKPFAIPVSPEKDGFKFKGWATDKAGSAPERLYQYGDDPITVSGNLELHAIWARTYTVTLMNGQTEYAKSVPLESGESYTIGEDPATSGVAGHTGCVFLGWAETEDGETKYFKGSTVAVTDEDITLWAVWGHTVTLYDRQADGTWAAHEDGSATVRHGAVYSLGEDAHAPHTGDIFLGWAGDDTRDADGYRAQVKYAYNKDAATEFQLTENINLYAIWAHDYISQAVSDSVKWFNEDAAVKANRAVDKLKELIHQELNGQGAAGAGFNDKFEVGAATYNQDTRTVDVTFTAETNSASMLAVAEFAVRYAAAMYNSDDVDQEGFIARFEAIMLDVLKELGYDDTAIDHEKLDKFLDELAADHIQSLKGRWFNLDGNTCVGQLTVTVGAQTPVVIAVPSASMEAIRQLAKDLAAELGSEMRKNDAWTSDMALKSAIKLEFSPADQIAAAYQTAAKEDGLFPTEYMVNVTLNSKSDYLAYKYDGEHYVKVTVPEGVKSTYNAKAPEAIQSILKSQPVQDYLKEVSQEIENQVKTLPQYTEIRGKLNNLGTSFGVTADMGAALDTQLHQWMADNYLAPDDSGKMDVMQSFLVTGVKSNTALYELVTANSATAKTVVKGKLDKCLEELPDSASVPATLGIGSMGGYVSITAHFPLDHNPYELIMNAIKGGNGYDTIEHPENLIKNIQSALSMIKEDLNKLEREYLTAGPGTRDSDRYPKADELLTKAVKEQVPFYANNWNLEKNTGYIRWMVQDAQENVDAIRKDGIAPVETLLNSLEIDATGDTAALFQPILTYFYADIINAFDSSLTISEAVNKSMTDAMDTFIDSAVDSKLADLRAYINLVTCLKKAEDIDAMWQVKPSDVLTLLNNEQAKKILSGKVLTEAVWARLERFVGKMEADLNRLPDDATITIDTRQFSKTELNAALAAVKAHDYDALVTALDTLLGDLKNVSLADFTEENPILVTVAYGGRSVKFYLVLERAWNKAA